MPEDIWPRTVVQPGTFGEQGYTGQESDGMSLMSGAPAFSHDLSIIFKVVAKSVAMPLEDTKKGGHSVNDHPL